MEFQYRHGVAFLMAMKRKGCFSKWAVIICLLSFCLALEPGIYANPDSTAGKSQETLLELPQIKSTSKDIGPKVGQSGSRTRLNRRELKNTAAIAGDPLRAIGTQPGISTQNDFNARPYVRGGTEEETRVFLNGIPLIQPYHFGSIFSIFNLESVDRMTLYNSAFPEEASDVLSGAFMAQSRRPAMDSFYIYTDVSMLRGNAYLESPVIRERLSFNLAYQDLWYQHSVKALMTVFAGDSAFETEMQEYRKYVNLPRFQDWQFGASLKLSETVLLHYTGISASDYFNVTIPRQRNYFRQRKMPLVTEVPILPQKNFRQAQEMGLDSLSLVDIRNQVHIFNLPCLVRDNLWLQSTFGFQRQVWDAAFLNREDEPDTADAAHPASWYRGLSAKDFRLDYSQSRFNFNQRLEYTGWRRHWITFGGEFAYGTQSFHTRLPLPIYEMISSSSIDLLGGLRYFSDDGFTIVREDPSQNAVNYLGEYPRRLRFDHRGSVQHRKISFYGSDKYRPTKAIQMELGFRGDYNLESGEFAPGPRFSLYYKINPKNDFKATTGLYSKLDHPFYQRNVNTKLRAEKSLHANLEWERAIGKRTQLEWRNYGKYNYDIATPELVPTGDLDLSGLLLPRPGTGIPQEEIEALRAILETGPNPSELSAEDREKANRLFGDLSMLYKATGSGFAMGSELLLRYAPGSLWEGYVSAELSLSRRRDDKARAYYNYAYHRPWSLNWVNTIHLPGNYKLGFKYNRTAGYAYTPYSGTLNDGGRGDSLIVVGPRNSRRYAPYTRLDLRLVKQLSWNDHRFQTYFEVWNAFNSPNYFLRDYKSGELKYPDLNLPFPFLFFGLIYSW